MFVRCCCLMTLIAVAPAASAGAGWSGDAGLGYLATSGNSSTRSLNGKLAVAYDAGSWKNYFEALSVISSDQGTTSAERYAASDKVDWRLTEHDYVFAGVDWEKDRFGGVLERTSETAGYGRHVLRGPVHLMDIEVGTGARQSKANNNGMRDNDMIFRGLGKYTWKISGTSKFTQALKVESGKSNTYTESVSELKLSVVGNLFAGIGYTVKHNSDVPVGTVHTDTFTTINLSYSFGKS